MLSKPATEQSSGTRSPARRSTVSSLRTSDGSAAVVASSRTQSVPPGDLYLAGLLPGLLLVVLTAIYGILIGYRSKREYVKFSLREVFASAWSAKWELLLPIFIVTIFVAGLTTMLQTAAAALAYVVIIECFITRDIKIFSQLPRIILKASTLMGAVLTLLSVAMGLTNYMVDIHLTDMLLGWLRTHIHSQVVFLLAFMGSMLGVLLSGASVNEVDERGQSIRGNTLLVLYNAADSRLEFHLPGDGGDHTWQPLVDTAREHPSATAFPIGGTYTLEPKSMALLRREEHSEYPA